MHISNPLISLAFNGAKPLQFHIGVGLLAIIRYHLKLDPYDGSVYVFRDSVGSMLKYIEWDGQSFLQGKRRAQSGTYPWPKGEPGSVVEVNEREFTYLLSKSIVPFKEGKCCDT